MVWSCALDGWRIVLVPRAAQAGHIYDDADVAVGVALVVVIDGAMGVQELVGDIGQDGSAARGDAALGDKDKEISEELVDGDGGLEVGEFPDEPNGEIEILGRYWQALNDLMPDAFKNPDRYVIQKTPGVFSLHSVFPLAFELARQLSKNVNLDAFI